MKEEILDWITGILGPDTKSLYERAFDLFQQINFLETLDYFQEIMNLSDDRDIEDTTDLLNEALYTQLEVVLKQHGVFIQKETPISVMLDIIENLIGIENSQEQEQISIIYQSSSSDEEKLAEILELNGVQSSEYYLEYIERINPGLVRKIGSLFSTYQPSYNVDNNNIGNKVLLIKKLYSKNKDSSIYQKLNEGLKFNMQYQFYLDLFWPIISEQNPENLARDLIGIAVISCDQFSNVLAITSKSVGEAMSDIDLIGRINDSATKLFIELNQDSGIVEVK